MKRWRIQTAKPGELKAAYGKEPGEYPDIFYCNGADGSTARDARMLAHFFESVEGFSGMTLRKELEERGYDITTLKFSIQQKRPDKGEVTG